MQQISIFILLVGVWLGVTAGRIVQHDLENRIEDEDPIQIVEGALSADWDAEVDAAILKAISRGEISLEELLRKEVFQELEDKLVDGSLMDSSWSKCLTINENILGFRINTQVCVIVEWLSTNMGFRVTIKIGSYTFSKEISVSNPPKLCYGIPGVSFVKACIQFYNINISNKSGCVKLSISFFSWNIGCFDFVKMQEERRLHQHLPARHRIEIAKH
ncbi:hypothetical protein CHS0354_034085 [Potamilus streckersoni]|uniref:DUF4773 domain-containing protein n=1 Tax=Potamilus streckersoni TaxID=2493646 RepID=A0AAE0VKK7_9BIVA|nr:hypothetical protein CHS0354_034085 [Potamilus streckersoni]